MSGWQSWRPSLNVAQGQQDPYRRFMVEAAGFAPNDWRQSYGYAPIADDQRDALQSLSMAERPTIDPAQNWYGVGRDVRPMFDPEPAKPQPATQGLMSFMQQNDASQFNNQVGGMLGGAPDVQSPFAQALLARFGALR